MLFPHQPSRALKKRFVYFYLLCVFCLHVPMCAMCVLCVQRDQKRALEPQELELPIVVSYHVGPGTYLGSLQEHPVCWACLQFPKPFFCLFVFIYCCFCFSRQGFSVFQPRFFSACQVMGLKACAITTKQPPNYSYFFYSFTLIQSVVVSWVQPCMTGSSMR